MDISARVTVVPEQCSGLRELSHLSDQASLPCQNRGHKFMGHDAVSGKCTFATLEPGPHKPTSPPVKSASAVLSVRKSACTSTYKYKVPFEQFVQAASTHIVHEELTNTRE